MNKTSPIIFFGNEKFATGLPAAEPIIQNSLRRAGYQIEEIVTTRTIPKHETTVAVLAAYGKILPQEVLDQFPLGIINVHPSLLPQYRGPTPIEQAILGGVAKTGVSIMKLTQKMDAGPIYKQKTLHLSGGESKAELAASLQRLGAELLLEVLPEIINGSLSPRQQPHPDRTTYSKLLKKSDGEIDWNKSAVRIEREIRAYLGWPGSRAKIAGKDVIITDVTVVDQTGRAGEWITSAKNVLEPHKLPYSKAESARAKTVLSEGEVPVGTSKEEKQFAAEVSRSGDERALRGSSLLVFCGQQALVINRLKPAGGKEMTGQAFMSGLRD